MHVVNFKRSAPSTSTPAPKAKDNAPASEPTSSEAAKSAAVRFSNHDDSKVYSITNGYDVAKNWSAHAKSDDPECLYEFHAIENASDVVS